MDRKTRVHDFLKQIAEEILLEIKEQEPNYSERWVSAAQIKKDLELDFVAVPKANKQYGEKGWFFAIITRMLEDENKIEYKKTGSRAYYRTIGTS
jgi:hypothetical protein